MIQKVVKAFPPNFVELKTHFPIKGQQGILYSWGDRIYNPSGGPVAPWLLAHEAVHGERQLQHVDPAFVSPGESIDLWWRDYIDYPEFRLTEEKLAHHAEWQAYRGKTPDLYLEGMARRLSGPLYGNLITLAQAKQIITEPACE